MLGIRKSNPTEAVYLEQCNDINVLYENPNKNSGISSLSKEFAVNFYHYTCLKTRLCVRIYKNGMLLIKYIIIYCKNVKRSSVLKEPRYLKKK